VDDYIQPTFYFDTCNARKCYNTDSPPPSCEEIREEVDHPYIWNFCSDSGLDGKDSAWNVFKRFRSNMCVMLGQVPNIFIRPYSKLRGVDTFALNEIDTAYSELRDSLESISRRIGNGIKLLVTGPIKPTETNPGKSDDNHYFVLFDTTENMAEAIIEFQRSVDGLYRKSGTSGIYAWGIALPLGSVTTVGGKELAQTFANKVVVSGGTLTIDRSIQNLQLRIINIIGAVVYEHPEATEHHDVSFLPQGVFLVAIGNYAQTIAIVR